MDNTFRKKFKIIPYLIIIICLIIISSLLGYIFSFNFTLEMKYPSDITETFFADMRMENTEELRNTTQYIKNECKNATYYKRCLIRWVENSKNNINYTTTNETYEEENYYVNKNPSYSLKYGGDCQSRAVYMANLLLLMNITDVYYVTEPKHVCLAVEINESMRTMNCNGGNQTIIKKVRGFI